jgi:hypothetical protein
MNPSRCLPPILALIERNELEESENLSEMSVSRRCKGSTHCEFCKLKIQLAVNSLGSILDTLKGVSK